VSKLLRIRIFAHSWISDWNHGNAHFLRGLALELARVGHEVRCYERKDSWSFTNLMQEPDWAGDKATGDFRRSFPMLDHRVYALDETLPQFLRSELTDSDLVLVHEWNDHELVSQILEGKPDLGFRALFHDTHHRAYTQPKEIARFPLDRFDGVLAFGEAIRQIYLQAFGVRRVWTFHEAADTQHFRPLQAGGETDVLWVGNWGDEERTRELLEFLIGPAQAMPQRKFAVHGVRYPAEAQACLAAAGIEYRGYLPNLQAPQAYAESLVSLHVPRRFYSNGLSGVPTIRVFEALACGVPLVCAPWSDAEGLFRPGQDYVCVSDGKAMRAELENLLRDSLARTQLGRNGLQTIQARHTCAHRAEQLIDIYEELGT
jgi:spore maturation protein CgeB